MFGILGDYLIIIIIFFAFFVLSLLEGKFNIRYKKVIIFCAIIILSVLAALRSIGTDTNSYILIFEQLKIVTLNSEFLTNMFQYYLEPGFNLMISYLKLFGFTYKEFFFICSFIPLLIVSRIIIKKEQKYVFLTFFIFLLVYLIRGPLDVIRQFFAAVIYLSALYSLSNKNKITYFIKVLIAILFHYSSILFLVITPFLKIKWTIKRFISFSLLLSLTGFLFKNLFVTLILSIDTVSTNRFILKLQGYIENEYIQSSVLDFIINNSMWYLPKVLNLIIILIILVQYRYILVDNLNKLLLNAQIIGILLFLLFLTMGAEIIALRLETLLTIGNFFLIKEIIVNSNKNKIYTFIFFVIFLVLTNLPSILYILKLRTNLL